MEKLAVNGLTGIIISSNKPEELATFYKDVLGIPLKLNRHGNMPEHWECDYNGIHFAILKRKNVELPNENIVLSFAVNDIHDFLSKHSQIKLIHPVMDLGEGASIASFKDVDGNTLRLWMYKTGVNS